MIQFITDGVSAVIGYFGSVINATITSGGAWYSVAPLIGVAVAVGFVFGGIRICKSLIKGY